MTARLETIAPSEIETRASALVSKGARFASLVGDEVGGQLRLTYAFVDSHERTLALLRAPLTEPKIPSIARAVPAASWAERESHELWGIEFVGSPDTRPLALHEDWPDGLHPLRSDFQATTPPTRVPRPFAYTRVEGEGVMEIPVGPIHAGIIEPGHFRFSTIGETVLHLEGRLFYVHRGLELRARGLEPAPAVVLAERASANGSVAHGLALARALEAATGVAVDPGAKRLRAVCLELERLWNHVADVLFLCAGTSLAVVGAEGLILKERLYRVNEALTGSRWLRDVVGPGGVRRGVPPENLSAALAEVDRVLRELEGLEAKLFGSASNMERLTGTGVLSAEHARNLGVVGVGARASGIATDSRADLGLDAGLAEESLIPSLRHEGDVLARARVRIDEIAVSRRLLSQLVRDPLPASPVATKLPADATGEGWGWAEGARGEVLTYVRLEAGRVARLKPRSPSRMNWPAVTLAMPGNIVPDFPLINKSFDLSYGGCDL